MPHAPPLERTDVHLTIGPLAARFGVSPETLRVWEQKGLMPPSRRTPGGHRRYGQPSTWPRSSKCSGMAVASM